MKRINIFSFVLVFVIFFSSISQIIALNESLTISTYGTINYNVSVKRPYVDGVKIIASDSELIPIGVIKGWSVVYYTALGGIPPTNWVDETEGVYNLLNDPTTPEKETEFNIVMINDNRWLWENDPNYIPALHNLVDYCRERGIYVIIRWAEWINRDYGQPGYGDEYMNWDEKVDIIIELNGWRDHAVSIAEEFKNDPTVIGISPLNEPTPPTKGWTAKGYTAAQAQQIWYDNTLQVIDSIHAVDSSYIVFVPPLLGYATLRGAVPWNRPNLVYTVHWYYGWDTEWGNAYADAYWNAVTEQDFENAYTLMEQHYQREMLNFRDQYNVPVMNSETSMCKLSYRSDSLCRNTERQFQDQIRLGAEKGFGQLYYQMDRDANIRFWGLLNSDDPETWSSGGLSVKEFVNQYFQ